MPTSNTFNAMQPTLDEATTPMIEREKFDALLNELERERQKNRDLNAQLALRRQQEKGEVWYWQAEGGNYLHSLSCPVVISAANLRALLDARPFKPANDDIQHEVIDSAYSFTVDDEGHVFGLTAGDQHYEPTGIRLCEETMQHFAIDKAGCRSFVVTAQLYQAGVEPSIDRALKALGFKADMDTTWWHVRDALHQNGHHLNAAVAQRHAVPPLQTPSSPIAP